MLVVVANDRKPIGKPLGSLPRAIRNALALVAVAAATIVIGCRRTSDPTPPPNVVARINDRVILVRDVEAEIAARAPGFRAQQYKPMAKREELLESIVTFEVLGAEAERRGYGRDPRVIRTMKEQMVSTMLQQEIEQQLSASQVSEKEIEDAYRRRAAEFELPEQARVSQIVVRDERMAWKVVRLARSGGRRNPADDQKSFRDLVLRFSEDSATRVRGGELGTLTRQSAGQTPALLDAALALTERGAVSDPVRGPHGFHILKLIERTPATIRPLNEVRSRIVQELLGERRSQKTEEFVAALRARAEIKLYKEELAKLQLPDKPTQPSAHLPKR
jgi:parvulin-like peptidyl-prolyl isomerase